MVTKTGKTKPKRLSKGQRTNIRRLKQEARKTDIPDSKLKNRSRPSSVSKKENDH